MIMVTVSLTCTVTWCSRAQSNRWLAKIEGSRSIAIGGRDGTGVRRQRGEGMARGEKRQYALDSCDHHLSVDSAAPQRSNDCVGG